MANTKSAIKRARQNERRRVRNRIVRTSARTAVKKALTQIGETNGQVDMSATVEAVRMAVSALDKAAQKGVIHRNNAARRKSRLMKRLNTLNRA